MSKAGRPQKRNIALADLVCAALEEGASYELAAAAAGISYSTLNRWRKDDEAFATNIATAESRAARRWLGQIDQAASKDWRAAAWLLERRYPEVYRRGEYVPEPAPKRREVFRVTIDGDPDSDSDRE